MVKLYWHLLVKTATLVSSSIQQRRAERHEQETNCFYPCCMLIDHQPYICNDFCNYFILRIWPCKFTLYLQITLFTVLRRKKKCIRYLQGEGRCASPVSSDGSAIDSPPSPLDVLQCISSAFTPDKLADFTHRNQTNPFPVSAHIKTATSTSGLASKCSAMPHSPVTPSDSSGYSVVSIET